MDYKKAAPVIVLSIVMFGLVGHVIATQMIASALVYNPQFLGEPMMVDKSLNLPLYWPWKVYTWSSSYMGGQIDPLLQKSLLISAGSVPTGGLVGLAGSVRLLANKTSNAHGSARWMSDEEIAKSDLTVSPLARYKALMKLKQANRFQRLFLKKYNRPDDSPYKTSSIVIGKDKHNNHFYDWGSEHVMVFAPTRSGKGVGLIIPTLYTWTGSVVVTDLKGENYALTSDYRSKFSKVLCFNPTERESVRINPLMEIRRGDRSVQDVGNLVEILDNGDGSNAFWSEGAKNVLEATILFVLYTCKTKTLGMVYELLYDEEALMDSMLLAQIENDAVRGVVQGIATLLKNKDEKVRGGWFAGAQIAMKLWKDPYICNATSQSDFKLRDLQHADEPISLYFVIPPGDVVCLSPLIRLIFTQMIDVLAPAKVFESVEQRRLLMLCDEFPQFGKMPKVEQAMSYTAGYGIKWMIICQGLVQFDQVYGQYNTFLMNCRVRLAYPCNDEMTAKRLSELLGVGTYKKTQKGKSGKAGWLAGASSKSVTEIEYERYLMTPGELMQFDENRIIIMRTGKDPILGHRITFYDDPHFMGKVKINLPPTSDDEDSLFDEFAHDWSDVVSPVRQPIPEAAFEMVGATPQAPTPEDAQVSTPEEAPFNEFKAFLKADTQRISLEEIRLVQDKLKRANLLHDEVIDEVIDDSIESLVPQEDALDVFIPSFDSLDEDSDEEHDEVDEHAFTPGFLNSPTPEPSTEQERQFYGKENIATTAISMETLREIAEQDKQNKRVKKEGE